MTTTKRRAAEVARPIATHRASINKLTNILPHRRRRYNITLTRDFWGIIAILVTLIMLPVLHMLLCMWGGVA